MTYSAPQNDSLNLSFVKDVNVVAKNCPKMVINDHLRVVNFLTKLKIKGNEKLCDLCCSF